MTRNVTGNFTVILSIIIFIYFIGILKSFGILGINYNNRNFEVRISQKMTIIHGKNTVIFGHFTIAEFLRFFFVFWIFT